MIRTREPGGTDLAEKLRDILLDRNNIALSGRAELLLRFSDALTEVDGLEGAQVHRSHWVAWEAVIGSERDGARLFLRLADGDRVPVSRRFHDTVANQGLL